MDGASPDRPPKILTAKYQISTTTASNANKPSIPTKAGAKATTLSAKAHNTEEAPASPATADTSYSTDSAIK